MEEHHREAAIDEEVPQEEFGGMLDGRHGRAGVVLPDNVLFEAGRAGESGHYYLHYWHQTL